MSGRFYPDLAPDDPQHPRREDFAIVAFDDGRGRGLIARRAFAAGERMARIGGFLCGAASLDTIQLAPDLHVADPWFCRFLLHSCDPCAAIETNNATLVARRAVAPGEVVTIDYGASEDRLGRQFECRCGAPACRRWMKGRKEATNEEGRQFLASLGNGDA